MNWEGCHAVGLTGVGMTIGPLTCLLVSVLVYCEFVALLLCSHLHSCKDICLLILLYRAAVYPPGTLYCLFGCSRVLRVLLVGGC